MKRNLITPILQNKLAITLKIIIPINVDISFNWVLSFKIIPANTTLNNDVIFRKTQAIPDKELDVASVNAI